MLTSLLYYQRRYEEAIQQGEKTLELYPDFVPIYGVMAAALSKLNEVPKAIGLMQKAYDTAPSISRLAVLGYLHAQNGDGQKAKEILEKIDAQSKVPVVENFYIYVKL